MNSEQCLFIQCLRDFIHESETLDEALSGIDNSILCKYAKKHEVEAIIYRQTHVLELEQNYYAQIVNSRKILEVRREIENRFANIDHFIVKGPVIAEYYPIPEMRSMGDIDIYVHVEDRDRAHDLLADMGFNLGSQWGEWVYYGEKFCVELHTAMVYRYSQCTTNEKQRVFFNSFWDYVQKGILDINFHIFYLFMHLRKHIMETGVGFRQFMDIAVVPKNCPDIDWTWIKKQAYELDMLPFLQQVMKFIEKCFAIHSPLGGKEIPDDTFEVLCNRIFMDGVFGFSNKENQANKLINEFNNNGKSQINADLFHDHFFGLMKKWFGFQSFHG